MIRVGIVLVKIRLCAHSHNTFWDFRDNSSDLIWECSVGQAYIDLLGFQIKWAMVLTKPKADIGFQGKKSANFPGNQPVATEGGTEMTNRDGAIRWRKICDVSRMS